MTELLRTARLVLRDFTPDDHAEFARLHADPETMADLGGPISEEESLTKLCDYLDDARRYGVSRLHVSDACGFIGYVGVRGHGAAHPLGRHFEVGWRLLPRVWRMGYATEAADCALRHAFLRPEIPQVLAYTAPANTRSRAVIERLNLRRRADLDFTEPDPVLGSWQGQVWVAERAAWSGSG